MFLRRSPHNAGVACGGNTNGTWAPRVASGVHQMLKMRVESVWGVEEFVPRVTIEVSI